MGPDAFRSGKWPLFHRIHPFLLLRIPALSYITLSFHSQHVPVLAPQSSPKPKIPAAIIETQNPWNSQYNFHHLYLSHPQQYQQKKKKTFLNEIWKDLKGRGRNIILCSVFQCPSNVCFGLYFMLVFFSLYYFNYYIVIILLLLFGPCHHCCCCLLDSDY